MHEIFLSICIPSYNRPSQLSRLLNSIDITFIDDIEIIICEDKSPSRNLIINEVNKYRKISRIACNLFLNNVNLGYDENLKELIYRANGKYIIFMGDDDIFEKNSLDEYLIFLKKNPQLGYILRRYSIIHKKGDIENFNYFNTDKYFKAGPSAFSTMFRKSVFISGFCFKKELVLPFYNIDNFKGTLLYQLYLCAEIVINYPSAYCNIPITIMDQNFRGQPEFGNSHNEQKIYTPGKVTIQNSINFMKSFLIITKFLDEKYNYNYTQLFIKDLSKYSYPVLSIQRDAGFFNFLIYNKVLIKEIKINKTIYYYLYFIALLIFNTKLCDKIIIYIKKIFKKTPSL